MGSDMVSGRGVDRRWRHRGHTFRRKDKCTISEKSYSLDVQEAGTTGKKRNDARVRRRRETL